MVLSLMSTLRRTPEKNITSSIFDSCLVISECFCFWPPCYPSRIADLLLVDEESPRGYHRDKDASNVLKAARDSAALARIDNLAVIEKAQEIYDRADAKLLSDAAEALSRVS